MKFTRPLLITKLKATGIHLSLSILVFIYLRVCFIEEQELEGDTEYAAYRERVPFFV